MLAIIDFPALVTGVLLAAAIATITLWAHFGVPISRRRGWIVAGLMVLALTAIAALDIAREPTHETKLLTPFTGVVLSTLGTLGMVRATRRVPTWLRAMLVFVVALLLLFGGMLLGATYISRLIPV